MGLLIYGVLFEKTGGNVLYILLIGTVLTTFFSSIQASLVRMMDPNVNILALGRDAATSLGVDYDRTTMPMRTLPAMSVPWR